MATNLVGQTYIGRTNITSLYSIINKTYYTVYIKIWAKQVTSRHHFVFCKPVPYHFAISFWIMLTYFNQSKYVPWLLGHSDHSSEFNCSCWWKISGLHLPPSLSTHFLGQENHQSPFPIPRVFLFYTLLWVYYLISSSFLNAVGTVTSD